MHKDECIWEYGLIFNDDRIPILLKKTRIEPMWSNVHAQTFTNPDAIVDLLENHYQASKLPEEYVWLACFDVRNHMLGIFEVAHGSSIGACLNAKGIMQRSLMLGAAHIIMVHNHPSGDVDPSQIDIKAAKIIFEAAKIHEMELLDSIIIGSSNDKMIFGSMYGMCWEEVTC